MEPRILYATVREALDEIHIECRFEDGQKFPPITVDEEFEELAADIAEWLNTRAEKSGWISVADQMPAANHPVLCVVRRQKAGAPPGELIQRRIRVQYAPPMTLELDPEADSDGADYDETRDMFFVKEGWYETNEFEETHWRVDSDWTVTHWMPLPAFPAG